MKRCISVLLLLLMVCLASAALASTPIVGRTHVYGYMDKIIEPENKFAPYVILTDVPYSPNCYVQFHYIREDLNNRHWALEFVDAEGNPVKPAHSHVSVYLPYPSIWSKAEQSYWKWTKNYAQKHYTWSYAFGKSANAGNGNEYSSIWVHDDFRTVSNMTNFGPCIYTHTVAFDSGFTIFIKFE